MVAITLSLTKAQLNRLDKGLGIRCSAKQLQSGDQELDVSEEMAKKVAAAQRRGQGCVISSLHVDGGSLKSIRRSFKKIGKTVTRIANDVPGEITKGSHVVGDAVQSAKKYVPRGAVKLAAGAAITAALTMAGQPELIPVAKAGVLTAVDATYETNLKHGSVGKKWLKSYGRNFDNNAAQAAYGVAASSAAPTGAGLGKRPAKGTPEMKQWMQALRDRKGKAKAPVMGTGFISAGSGFISTGTSGRTEGRGFISTGRGISDTKGNNVLTMADHIERRAVRYSQVASLDSKGGNFVMRKMREVHGAGFVNV